MTQEKKDILNDYAKIKLEIKLLEEKAELLNAQALEIIQEAGVEEIEVGDLGKLLIGKRRKWTFPKDVEDWRKDLKEKEKEAQQRGTATYIENAYIIFSKNKEE